jgi:hypothetical protein
VKRLGLLTLFFSLSLEASPMSQMNGRLGNYNQVMGPDHCAAAVSGVGYNSSDYGLMTSVECEITCQGQSSKRIRAAGSFIPSSYGLYPGDGSSENNTLWRSLAVTMKVWSEEVCLGEAADLCKGLQKVTDSSVMEIESGEWKMNHTLGCDEKAVTLSPFDNTVNSKRLPAPLAEQLNIVNQSHSLPVFDQTFKLAEKKNEGECQHKMEDNLCFGDCVHEMENKEWKETLATPSPLGRAKETWCMDGIVATLKTQQKLSLQVKVKICEAYFWSSMMHSHGPGTSCAAVRGEHQCEKLIQSL